jgi:rubrerythrin
MDNDKINSIIDFAIEEERGAAELYNKTAETVTDKNLVALLKDMANMELGHEAKLKALKEGKIAKFGETKVQDLKIGDYLVDVEINENSSIQDIMLFSIKSEMKAHELYTQLCTWFEGEEEKAMFQNLANEELKHKNDLEKAYDDYVYQEN